MMNPEIKRQIPRYSVTYSLISIYQVQSRVFVFLFSRNKMIIHLESLLLVSVSLCPVFYVWSDTAPGQKYFP